MVCGCGRQRFDRIKRIEFDWMNDENSCKIILQHQSTGCTALIQFIHNSILMIHSIASKMGKLYYSCSCHAFSHCNSVSYDATLTVSRDNIIKNDKFTPIFRRETTNNSKLNVFIFANKQKPKVFTLVSAVRCDTTTTVWSGKINHMSSWMSYAECTIELFNWITKKIW